jgi:hypothetical protein
VRADVTELLQFYCCGDSTGIPEMDINKNGDKNGDAFIFEKWGRIYF